MLQDVLSFPFHSYLLFHISLPFLYALPFPSIASFISSVHNPFPFDKHPDSWGSFVYIGSHPFDASLDFIKKSHYYIQNYYIFYSENVHIYCTMKITLVQMTFILLGYLDVCDELVAFD